MKKSKLYFFLYFIRIIFSVSFLVLAVLGILGLFYPIKIFSVQISNLILSSLHSFGFFTLLILFLFLLIVFIFGNFYCSTLCPLGALQEIIFLLRQKKTTYIKPNNLRYFILILFITFYLFGANYFIKYIDPFFIFSTSFNLSIISIFVFLLILIFALFKNRLFCRLICPIGALLGFISKFSIKSLQIDSHSCVNCGKCENVCSYACIDSSKNLINDEICSKCLKCLSVCEFNAIQYKSREKANFNFDIKRRNFIIGSISLIAMGGLIKSASQHYTNRILSNFKSILPPNSLSKIKFINSCVNCGLCVSNCPSKIIKNTNTEVPFLHFEFQGGYCKEDCNICGKVCPTGSIQNFKIEDKYKIKIAEARIVSQICTHCDLCIKACPYGAITKEYLQLPIIDKNKCIGCGACKVVCDSNTIDLFALND